MNRRQFLTSGAALAVASSRLGRYAEAFADTPLRVGLIGTRLVRQGRPASA